MLQVDAFTTTPLAGNPCAVLLEAGDLDTGTMQRIAREMNLSETAFVVESDVADVGARYFTPAEEVPLAGHPTIATVHALVELGRIGPDEESITLELTAGVIGVTIDREEGGGAPLITMTQLAPSFGRRLNRAEASAALRVPESAVRADVPVQVVSTGTPQLMVAVTSRTALAGSRPDASVLAGLREKAGFFSAHAFTTDAIDPAHAAFSRHWGFTESGLFEDPVTGSASGGMVAFMLRYGLLEAGSYVLEQGDGLGRTGRVRASVDWEWEGKVAAPRVGGRAVTVMRGVIRL